jgi:hypothetical protein
MIGFNSAGKTSAQILTMPETRSPIVESVNQNMETEEFTIKTQEKEESTP